MKKRVLSLIVLLISAFFVTTNVYALDVAEAGDTITQEGSYDSTRFVAGNQVTNKADIDGLSFIAGNELNLEGTAPYGFYAGNNIKINENVKKDMFVAGNEIVIDSNAFIGRDLYIAGNIVKINSNITRDLRVASSSVDLSGVVVGGDVYVEAEQITLDKNTVITGKLTYPEEATITGIDDANIGSKEAKPESEIVIETSLKDKVYDFVISAIASFIVMIVLIYLIPKSKEKLDNIELSVNNIAKTIGIGLVVLIVVPIVSLIAVFTGILTPLALIIAAIYIISIYLSSLLVSYIVGKKLDEMVIKKDNMYLSLACGIIIVKVIKLMPAIGGLVSAIALFYGLGIIYKFIKNKGA